MSISYITTSSDSDAESVRSSTSHNKTTILTAPTAILDPVSKSDPEESPEEDPSENDSFGDDVSDTTGSLEVQGAPAPPAPY
ncbi:hypothetical protein Tco_1236196 [Tanacetum coccineum]